MIKELNQLGLSDVQIAGIRMRLINVFLDNNSEYSVENLTRRNLSQRDVLIIKSGYFDESEKVLLLLTWLFNNENQFKSFFISNNRLDDYQILNFPKIISDIELRLKHENSTSDNFIDLKVSESYQNKNAVSETLKDLLFKSEETKTSNIMTGTARFFAENKVVFAA
ncbi:hypothetical protein [Weissella cibaria]|uniref:hypothetical protein n=1 Tax=Weissella cibaria TaxID=137591 RepID=UPI00106DD7BF|nr:hypothetical protein [Weissella cibaria]